MSTGQFNTLNTIYTNLVANIETLKTMKSTKTTDDNAKIDKFQKEIDDLNAKLDKLTDKEAAYNKEFQDIVYYPREVEPDTLQDLSVSIFVFGWFLLGFIVIYFAIFQSQGSWKKGLLVAILLILISAIIFNIFYLYL